LDIAKKLKWPLGELLVISKAIQNVCKYQIFYIICRERNTRFKAGTGRNFDSVALGRNLSSSVRAYFQYFKWIFN